MTTRRYSLLVPVKDSRTAKSRLAAGSDEERVRLMAAFARDAISAALACPGVEVHVVGDAAGLADLLAGLDVAVVPDEGRGDLNRALARAADRVRTPGVGVAAMLADLPCLRAEDLGAALAGASTRSFVADAAATGTTLLLAPPGADLDPRFGAGSAAAHAASGAREIGTALPSLRLDVDTTDDLAAAVAFGVGPHTADVVDVLGLR